MTTTPDPAVLAHIEALAAKQRADKEWRASPCPECGANGPYSALHGWLPCRCGGHATQHCQRCGHERHRPPVNDTCKQPQIGPSPTT